MWIKPVVDMCKVNIDVAIFFISFGLRKKKILERAYGIGIVICNREDEFIAAKKNI